MVTHKKTIMRNILYYIAAFLIVVWAIGIVMHIFFWAFHSLIIIAAVIILISLASGKKMIDE